MSKGDFVSAWVIYILFLDCYFSHSFGYECEKRSNLVVVAKDMVVYAAGNLVVLLDLDTQQQTCIRSLGEGGIGALAVSLQYTNIV